MDRQIRKSQLKSQRAIPVAMIMDKKVQDLLTEPVPRKRSREIPLGPLASETIKSNRGCGCLRFESCKRISGSENQQWYLIQGISDGY